MKSAIGTAIMALLLTTSCGSTPDPEQVNEILIPDYEISIVDSFGVEIGDSLSMIGSIDGFCYHPDGSILILDRAALKVRVISNQGETSFISREGEGPGEMLFPHGVCALQDGRILVSDEMKQEVMSYDISGNYLGSYFTTDRYVPYRMFQVDSSSIAGSMMDLEMGEEHIFFSFFFGRFDSDSVASVVYHNRRWEWPAPEMYTDIGLAEFAADCAGNVFVVEDNTSYAISAYSPEGNEMYRIGCPDVNRIPKTPEEIEEEIVLFESWAQEDQAYTGGYEPNPYHQLISLVGTDAEGNLWIERHDSENGCKFDVWDATGSLIFTASFPQVESDPGILFNVDQYGILAAVVDDEHFPQIYTLEIGEPEND